MTELASYTLEEVAQHNGTVHPEIWIVLDKNIYNVTEFVAKHPGGTEAILNQAGTDITEKYYNIQKHIVNNDKIHENLLPSMLVGLLK